MNWDEQELRKLYWEQDKSLKDIARIYACSYVTVQRKMGQLGIPLRTLKQAKSVYDRSHIGKKRKDSPTWTAEELYNLYWGHEETLAKIGQLYGHPKGTVLKAMRQYNIPTRTMREALKLAYQNKSDIKRGSAHWAWRGGKTKTDKGYIYSHAPEHPYHSKHGYVLEHRLVMEQKLGRYLLPFEKVHHLNGIKNDNRLENLILVSQANQSMYDELCSHCPLRKEIRLLKWQFKQLQEQLQYRLMED